MTTTQTDRLAGVVGNPGWKAPVRAIATSNITLSAEQTIDSVAVVSGDRVLVTGQTDGTENGIYTVSTGSWTRTKDFNGAYDVTQGTTMLVLEGTAYGGTYWRITTSGTITIGTTSLSWAATSASLAVVSTFMQTVLDDATAAAALTTLGGGAVGQAVFAAASAAAGRSALSVQDFAAATLLDEDNMASNSATQAASQQSIKAYIDNHPIIVAKSAEESVTSSSTYQNDDDLVATLEAGRSYLVEFVLFFRSTALSSCGLKYQWTGLGGSPVGKHFSRIEYYDGTSATAINTLQNSVDWDFGNSAVPPDETYCVVQGHLVISDSGDGGDLQLQWAQSISNGTALVMEQTAFMKVTSY